MHTTNRTERPSRRLLLATTDIPTDYHTNRLRWWTINSPSWSDHIDADPNRGALLAKLALRATEWLAASEHPIVVDVGCGEGSFLRILKALNPRATLQGLDFCPMMLTEAHRRSADTDVTYVLGDVEDQRFISPFHKADLVTSVLAMDEMDQLGVAFTHISASLKPGGTALIVVMDPTQELERNSRDLETLIGKDAQLDDPILLVKTFPRCNMEPAAPYSRIVRPLAQYVDHAAAGRLEVERVEQWPHLVGIGDYAGTLLFDILTLRKV